VVGYLKYDGAWAVETSPPTRDDYGTSGADTLTGTAAAESFWGGPADRMVGGGGDDTYYLKDRRDVVVELAGEGVDKIVAWHSVTLADHPNVENLAVSGDGLYAAGNALDNIVSGGAGKEQIYGGAGQDVLVGGAGADVFIVHKGEGNDAIADFNAAEDRVRLKAGLTSFAQVQGRLSQAGADVRLDMGDGDGLVFRNLTVGQLTAANFQLSLDPGLLGQQTFADEFAGPLSLWDAESRPGGVWRPDYGYQGAQGVGSYTLVSNEEKQVYTSPYFRDHAGDFGESPFVANADGTLSIWARPSANAEIFGYGYTSGLITTKESFSQTYGYFEMRADVPAGQGAWPAFWLLPKDGSWPPELDVMEVLGHDPRASWTTSHSAIGGHSSSGVASYTPDTVDGFHTYGSLWTPSETAWFIDGVEVYRVATPADMNKPMFLLANLALGGWAGTVDHAALPAEFRIDYIRAWNLAGPAAEPPPPPPPPPGPSYQNVLFELPQSAAWVRTLTGGAKQDTLTGTSGADYLDGKGNGDTLRGQGGDDTYVVDHARDAVVEAAGGGVDTVLSTALGHTLAANVENLKLIGAAAQGGTGNDLANRLAANDAGSTLSGGAGNDILVGGRGADVLTGGAGRDIFQFDRLPAAAGRITDFTFGEDMLDLRGLFRAAGYAGADPLRDGWLALKADGAGGTQVWFDPDGGGAKAAVLVTTVAGTTASAWHAQNDWFV
jgi:beta-glucanase (GH16 family)